MARAIDANELEMFPYSEGAGTEEQIADWIEQVGLSEDDTASRARALCWKVIEGFINVVKTQPTLTQPNEWVSVEERLPEKENAQVLMTDGEGCYISSRNNMVRLLDCEGIFIPGKAGAGVKVTHWMLLPKPPKEETENG